MTTLASAGSPSLTGELLAAHSPIRALLLNADRVGAVYRQVGYREALVITNDEFVRQAHGVPLHAFLIASTADLADPARTGQIAVDDEEIILLRVTDNAAVPQENDLEFLRATAGIDLVIEAGRAQPRSREVMIDPLTEARMQTAGHPLRDPRHLLRRRHIIGAATGIRLGHRQRVRRRAPVGLQALRPQPREHRGLHGRAEDRRATQAV